MKSYRTSSLGPLRGRRRTLIFFGCSTFLLVACVAAFLVYLLRETSSMLREFQELGFTEMVQGRQLMITNPVSQPVLYMAEKITIATSCSTNIAVMAQTAHISGEIQGRLYFRGRDLIITTNGIVLNGLNTDAQTIRNDGLIEGDIEGGLPSTELPAQEPF